MAKARRVTELLSLKGAICWTVVSVLLSAVAGVKSLGSGTEADSSLGCVPISTKVLKWWRGEGNAKEAITESLF